MVAIAAIVVVGLSGLLGVRTRTVGRVGDDGTVVTITYTQVARPGLAAPFSVRVEQLGGFDGQIEIETTAWSGRSSSTCCCSSSCGPWASASCPSSPPSSWSCW